MHNAVSILTPKRDRPSLHSFSIRDLLLVTVIVALALGWFLDHQRLVKLTEKLTKLTEENKQLQIQADLERIERTVQSREFEQFKLRTLVESLKSQAPAPNSPQKAGP
jgi:uncharacterized protein HemX